MGCGCHAADPVYAAHVAARSCACAPMGDLLPKVVWPSDVTAIKREIDPDMRATDASVARCTALDAGTRDAWRKFFEAWDAFYREPEPFLFGAANKYDEASGYRARLRAWQEKIAPLCKLDAPDVPKPPEEAGSADVVSALKFGAVAVIVAAAVYGVTRFV